MIANPKPPSTAEFSGMWLSRVDIMLPSKEAVGTISGKFHPYDGTNILANGAVSFRVSNFAERAEKEVALNDFAIALVSECQRQHKAIHDVKSVCVLAPSPDKPVSAWIVFTDGTSHTVRDCFALAKADKTFSESFNSALTALAGMAGLSIK